MDEIKKWWSSLSDNAQGFCIFISVVGTGLICVGIFLYMQNASGEGPVPSSSPSMSTESSPSSSPTSSTIATSQPSTSCFSAAQSSNEIGQNGCVEFTVGSTYVSSRCNAYLDQYSSYTSGFSVWIPDGCGLGSTLTGEYANKTIDVSGTITSYNGAPQIKVTDATQIQLAK